MGKVFTITSWVLVVGIIFCICFALWELFIFRRALNHGAKVQHKFTACPTVLAVAIMGLDGGGNYFNTSTPAVLQDRVNIAYCEGSPCKVSLERTVVGCNLHSLTPPVHMLQLDIKLRHDTGLHAVVTKTAFVLPHAILEILKTRELLMGSSTRSCALCWLAETAMQRQSTPSDGPLSSMDLRSSTAVQWAVLCMILLVITMTQTLPQPQVLAFHALPTNVRCGYPTSITPSTPPMTTTTYKQLRVFHTPIPQKCRLNLENGAWTRTKSSNTGESGQRLKPSFLPQRHRTGSTLYPLPRTACSCPATPPPAPASCTVPQDSRAKVLHSQHAARKRHALLVRAASRATATRSTLTMTPSALPTPILGLAPWIRPQASSPHHARCVSIERRRALSCAQSSWRKAPSSARTRMATLCGGMRCSACTPTATASTSAAALCGPKPTSPYGTTFLELRTPQTRSTGMATRWKLRSRLGFLTAPFGR